LTQPETQVLLDLAAAPAEVLARALRSVDDLRDPDVGVDPPPTDLAALLDRLGLYGVRVGCAAIRDGVRSADEIAAALRAASGIDGLLATIERVFITRAAVLRDHSVLAGLNDLARRHRSDPLSHAIEAVVAADRSWRELEALVALRTSPDAFGADAAADADRLLGGQGDDPAVRLDVPVEASPEERRAAAYEALDRWQRRAARPLAPPAHVALADTVVRTLEAMLAVGLSDR
jgi:hypothetical protein